MARQQRGLAARRAGLGYTQERFAEAVGVERSTVWRWENGAVAPLPEHCPRIRAVLGLTPAQLDELLRETAADRGSAPGQLSEHRAVSPALSWDDPDEVLLHLHELQESNIGDGQVRLLEDQVHRTVAEYEQRGPAELGPPTARLRRRVHQLLGGRQLLRTRYRLHRAAAQLSGLLGYMAVNTGRFRLASAYCAEALHLATEIEDIDLQVWVWGTRSLGAYYQADYARAHGHAARGWALAPNSPQSIRLLANGEARALGQLGDRAGADAAVGQALALIDRYDIDPGLTPCISFEPYGYARVAANAATAYVPLGDTARVLHYTGDVDPAVEQADSDWSRALVRLDIATAVLRQDDADLEQALALGREALRVCADHPIRSVWQRATTLHGLTQRWASEPRVIEFADQLRTWRGRPQVQAISGGTR
ncbi:helix-turn-helix transcriptional regulator [Amycolatopsis sp. K13G38]|uniref:Helix-turn-helix transcriptional regulator n=1 Tax=Amycolatopsis acididurans TaxID=2724524 RepID=A0ABX1J754_9PSEU|nr:helix-turn-helix transcriptional regulator [Amycolatopsis acididurans]NKQ55588.1 helix-turn-helix transcriptional regulator [Amycolatopsis acididurans]